MERIMLEVHVPENIVRHRSRGVVANKNARIAWALIDRAAKTSLTYMSATAFTDRSNQKKIALVDRAKN